MKVALVQCPAFDINKPPLALGYLAAFLRKHHYEVDIFDFNIDLYTKIEEKNKCFWEFKYAFHWLENDYFTKEVLLPRIHFKDWAKEIILSRPDIIGFSSQHTSLQASIDLAREIKSIASDKIIVFGGPVHLSYPIEHVYDLLNFDNGKKVKIIDIIGLGEGEETLINILRRIESKRSLKGCLGTIFMEDGQIINNGLRPLIHNLDTIPFPEFKDFPHTYKHQSKLSILGSRGCVNRCVFCDDTSIWRGYRFRSAENIVEEMKLRRRQGINFLEFNDLLINGNLKQLSKLCDLLIREKLDLIWGGSACIDNRMDLGFLEKLKQAGCFYLDYGIESASPNVLRDMNKSFTIEEAKKLIENTHKAGINVCTNWIVGFPTETYHDFEETINFIKADFDYLKNNIMVNSFVLKTESFVFQNKEKFGIAADKERRWYSQGGKNTVEERKRRYDEFIKLINEFEDQPSHQVFNM